MPGRTEPTPVHARIQWLCKRHQISRPTFYRLCVLPDFPKPLEFPIGGRRWVTEEVDRYFASWRTRNGDKTEERTV